MTFRIWFTEFIQTHDWSKLYKVEKSNYFKRITTDIEYWEPHLHMLETAGIDKLHMDAKILDIGVWFGVMPFALQQYGFTNVVTTERYTESDFKRAEFDVLWHTFDIAPIDLEIYPNLEFDLHGQYDLILISETNMFWKTDDVVMYDGNTVVHGWQTALPDGNVHTYFAPFKYNDLAFFISHIKLFLTIDGVAMVHPRPWVYHMHGFESELTLLKQCQHAHYTYPNIDELTDYIVVTQ